MVTVSDGFHTSAQEEVTITIPERLRFVTKKFNINGQVVYY